MATIKVKFSIGDLVEHFTGTTGMITAIFHRSGKNSYEFSYFDGDKLSCVNMEECEICANSYNSLGFKRK